MSAVDRTSPTGRVRGCSTLSSTADNKPLASVSTAERTSPTSEATGLMRFLLISDKTSVTGSTKAATCLPAVFKASSTASGRIVPPSLTYLPTPFSTASSISSPLTREFTVLLSPAFKSSTFILLLLAKVFTASPTPSLSMAFLTTVGPKAVVIASTGSPVIAPVIKASDAL